MKTDDLIGALAADLRAVGPRTGWRPARRIALLVPLAMLVVAGAFLGTFGLRAGLASAPVLGAVASKQAIVLTAAAAGLLVALRAADPVGARGAGRGLLLLPAALLVVAVLADIAFDGVAGWRDRLVGQTGLRCVLAIPVLGIPSLVAILAALREGAASRPALTGTLAGLAAAGLGAAIYALNCTDDSPLFVATWYGIAAAVMAGLGALAGRRVLRW